MNNQLAELTRIKLIRAINEYQELEQWEEANDRRDFQSMEFEQAVSIAGGGKRPDGRYHAHLEARHGRPLTTGRKAALAEFRTRLMSQTVLNEMRAATSFHMIHQIIERESVHDVGPVTVYDAAVSIGANRGYEPEEIYLHAAPLKGAKALIRGLDKTRIRPEELPQEARDLLRDTKRGEGDFTPGEIEDILCLFAGLL